MSVSRSPAIVRGNNARLVSVARGLRAEEALKGDSGVLFVEASVFVSQVEAEKSR